MYFIGAYYKRRSVIRSTCCSLSELVFQRILDLQAGAMNTIVKKTKIHNPRLLSQIMKSVGHCLSSSQYFFVPQHCPNFGLQSITDSENQRREQWLCDSQTVSDSNRNRMVMFAICFAKLSIADLRTNFYHLPHFFGNDFPRWAQSETI